MPTGPLILLADIGGTNTRIALADGPQLRPQTIRRYRNADHSSFFDVLTTFTNELQPERIIGACVATAGPVRNGTGALTNLNWRIHDADLADALGARVALVVNDLQAQGHALGFLSPGSVDDILPAPPTAASESQLVIGIGTGFNAAPVHETPTGRLVTASESGHVTLPITCDEDLRLAKFVTQNHGFAAVEEILSGRGVAEIDAFVAQETGAMPTRRDTGDILAAMQAGEDRAMHTMRILARQIGTVAGDLALTHLPFGGVYLVGGVARALTPHLMATGFADAFRAKGRFSDFMTAFSVRVIEDDYAALIGCARHLNNRLQHA